MLHVHPVGAVIGLLIFGMMASTITWMLHPPETKADRVAKEVEEDVAELIGSVIIVFSAEIHSEPLMALAVRLARKAEAQLLAAYVIEVPHTLPLDAEMEDEQRQALDVLATAEAIARNQTVEIQTDVIKTRKLSDGVLQLAKQRDAHLILLGAYREGKYSGAPLGRAIEMIAANAKCDVLIGVPGHGESSILSVSPTPAGKQTPAEATTSAAPPTGGSSNGGAGGYRT
ncbi:MAG: universal stress protein [Vulcanimicrobiaceae bacterium]